MSDLKRLIVLWIVAVLLFTAICLLIRYFVHPPPAEARTFVILQTADANGVPWPCQFDLVGDLNGDCRVDFKDVALLADNWLIDCNLALGDRRCHRKEYK